MTIKLIAAVSKEWGIGYKNDLLFRIKNDMKHFEELTTGQIVVYGRKTLESLPNPLPNRVNVVLTRIKNYKAPTGVIVMDSVETIINHYTKTGTQTKDIWVIGGSEVYRQFLPYADEVYLTHIDKEADNVDTYFPKEALKEYFDVDKYSEWHFRKEEDCSYCFVTFKHK